MKRSSRLTVTLSKRHSESLKDRAARQTAHTGQLVTPEDLINLVLEFYQTFPLMPEKTLGWRSSEDGLLWPDHPWKGSLYEASDRQSGN